MGRSPRLDSVLRPPRSSHVRFFLIWKKKVDGQGQLGCTYGTYVRSYRDGEGMLVTAPGYYTSIWRKQPDGSWKNVLDMGN